MANILVIEDESSMREFMVTMLESEGYEVDSAPDGAVGMKLYDQERYALVITDMRMPEKEDPEVCKELMEYQPAPEIIAFSAGNPNILKDVLSLGIAATYEKPFDVIDFLGSVHALLNSKRSQAD